MKSLFSSFTLLCLLTCIGSLCSCVDECDKEDDLYGTYRISFKFLDTYGHNLLKVLENRYNRDTVEIYDEDLEPLGIHPYKDGSMVLEFLHYPLNRDEPLDTQLERTFYVYFEEGDYDTLNIAYKIGLDDCNDKALTQWSVSYNDSLYFDLSNPPYSSRFVSFIK